MHGAYVAKPDAVSSPGTPPGWVVDWAFPPPGSGVEYPPLGPGEGPFPPGYDSVYSLVLAGADEVVPGENYAATLTLYDHESYGTSQPSEDITWMATLDGSPLLMKFAGGTNAYTLTSSYESLGSNLWGNVASIIFDISVEDSGKTIVLTAQSDPFSHSSILSTTKSITVVAAALKISWSGAASGDKGCGCTARYHGESGRITAPYAYLSVRYNFESFPSPLTELQSGGDPEDEYSISGEIAQIGEAQISILTFRGELYTVRLSQASQAVDTFMNVTYTFIVDGASYVRQINLSGVEGYSEWPWLTYNPVTGVVTIDPEGPYP